MDGAADDLDELIRRVDPDRWLSSRFIGDAVARADVIALYAFDHETGRAPRTASNPLVGEMRLVWWREVLEEIAGCGRVRAHPGAEALARAVRGAGLPLAPLERMIDARYRELDPAPLTAGEAAELARDTAGAVAGLAALRLDTGADAADAEPAGAAWALSRRGAEAQGLLREAADKARALPAAAFPAVAHATLARSYLAGQAPSELWKRLRLVTAVARGRI
ncbi:MAG: squalene/phytoene synthase family protein [Caulobacteraceae bacterium]|nr:squalene/phytoene synthase family protein [Caulobacteraceae bacterium]